MLVYAANGERGDALVDRIRSMTKEVEVGDEFTGKVVKTTTFGAFIELSKGTDGLLHISNVAPGRRIATVEEVLNKGDELERLRGRGRPRARPDRAAPRRRSRSRRQERRGARRGRQRRPGPPRRDRGDRGGRDGRGGRRPWAVTATASRDAGDRAERSGRVRDRDPERPRS